MADQELQKPAAAPTTPELVIHVIPEKFYGAALKQKTGKLPPPSVIPPVPPAAPVPKKKRGMLVPVIIALIVLLLGGGAVVFFLFSKKPASVVNVPVNAAPTGSRCGDGACNGIETHAICAADCPAPIAPVCGDTKCDSTETTASCAADCPAPAAVCGDAKCDATESVAACPSDCRPPEPVPGSDSDSDGLTDEEERSVYGTNPDDPNTDKDKYVDLNEVLSLFDPAKPDPALLADSPGITAFTSADIGASMLRPAGWTVAPDVAAKKVVFSAQGGETVIVEVLAKTGTETLAEWYRIKFPENASSAEPYRTRQGYEAIATPERMTVYIESGDKIVSVTYGLGDRLEIQYKVTYQMIIQSLRFLGR